MTVRLSIITTGKPVSNKTLSNLLYCFSDTKITLKAGEKLVNTKEMGDAIIAAL
jgi:hypothetical protein